MVYTLRFAVPLLYRSSNEQLPINVRQQSFIIRGDRSTEIALTRIRHNCSSLNADLYRVNIITSPYCTCGPSIETAELYIFECSLYALQRKSLFSGLPRFFHPDLDSLINGNELFNSDLNNQILHQVFKFMKETRRFRFVT